MPQPVALIPRPSLGSGPDVGRALPALLPSVLPVVDAWDWQLAAACRDVDTAVFFAPEAERGIRRTARERVAKAVCKSCPVLQRCREYALATNEAFGVWGGLTADERRRVAAGLPVGDLDDAEDAHDADSRYDRSRVTPRSA